MKRFWNWIRNEERKEKDRTILLQNNDRQRCQHHKYRIDLVADQFALPHNHYSFISTMLTE